MVLKAMRGKIAPVAKDTLKVEPPEADQNPLGLGEIKKLKKQRGRESFFDRTQSHGSEGNVAESNPELQTQECDDANSWQDSLSPLENEEEEYSCQSEGEEEYDEEKKIDNESEELSAADEIDKDNEHESSSDELEYRVTRDEF